MRYAEIARTLVVNLDAGRLHRLKAEWLAHGGRVRCVDFVWLLSRSATLGSDAHRWSDTEILGGMMRCWAELSHAEDGTVSWEVFSAFLAHTSTSLTQSIHRNEEVRIYRPAEPPTMDLSRELLRASAREPTHAQQTRKLGEGAVHISVLKMLFLGAPLDRYLLCERHGSTLHLRLYAPTPHGLPYSRELESAPFVLTDAAVVPEHSLLAGSYSGAWVQLWDTARNYAPIRRIGDAGLRTAIICLAWCRQSGYLVGGTASGSLAFFNAGANWAMREGAQSASGASITVLLRVQVPSVELIISGSLSGELRVCDVERAAQSERGGQRNVLIGHVGSISSLAYSEAHHYLISAGLDRCVFVWNLFAAHGVPVAKLNLSAAIIQLALPAGEMARGQGGRVVVAGDAQGRFRVISLRSLQVVQEFSAFVDDVEPLRGVGSLASGPAAARAAAGGRGGGGGASIDDEDGSRMVGFALDTAITDRLVLAPSRGALLRIMAPIGLRQPTPPVAGVVAGVSVQSLRASAALLDADSTLDGLSDARSILSVCLVQETQMVITVTETGVRTWEALTGAPIREYLDLSSEGLTAFCADGSRRFWIGCHDGRLREFSLLSGALQRECTPHSSEVVAIVLSARFRAIVTASWDGTVAITPNPTDGQPLATTESVRLRTHVHGDDETTAELSCVALSDDEELAAAGAQGAVYVWNMQHARREAVLVGPHAESEVTTVVFARRARCLFSADSRGFVAGWNLADGPHKYTAAIVINQSQRPEPALPVGTGPAAVRRRAHLDVSAAAGALLGASRAPIAVQAAVWDHACSTLYTADDAGTIVGWELVMPTLHDYAKFGLRAVSSWCAHEESVTTLALALVPAAPLAADAEQADDVAAVTDGKPSMPAVAPPLRRVLFSGSVAGRARLWLAPEARAERSLFAKVQTATLLEMSAVAGGGAKPVAGQQRALSVHRSYSLANAGSKTIVGCLPAGPARPAPELLGCLSLTTPPDDGDLSAQAAGSHDDGSADWSLGIDTSKMQADEGTAMLALIAEMTTTRRKRRVRRHRAWNGGDLLLASLWQRKSAAAASQSSDADAPASRAVAGATAEIGAAEASVPVDAGTVLGARLDTVTVPDEDAEDLEAQKLLDKLELSAASRAASRAAPLVQS